MTVTNNTTIQIFFIQFILFQSYFSDGMSQFGSDKSDKYDVPLIKRMKKKKGKKKKKRKSGKIEEKLTASVNNKSTASYWTTN